MRHASCMVCCLIICDVGKGSSMRHATISGCMVKGGRSNMLCKYKITIVVKVQSKHDW